MAFGAAALPAALLVQLLARSMQKLLGENGLRMEEWSKL